MNPLRLPWLELAIVVALSGSAFISRLRQPRRAYRWGVAFTGTSFVFSVLAWLSFSSGDLAAASPRDSAQLVPFGRQLFALDELSAPLVPAVASLHLLAAVATARAHMRRFSFSWSLAALALSMATFATREPWLLIGLLAASTVPPYVELKNRGRPTRLYVMHMALFVGLLILGWAATESRGPSSPAPWWATLPLMAAVLVRCGTVPAHCWVTDWFEHASFGIALLFVVPLSGVYTAIRLVLPIAPDWVLRSIGVVSLFTAVYSAGMAVIQREERRFFAHLFLSYASLVLVGLELHTELSLCASLCLWFSAILSLAGFGITLRALEARFGRLSLTEYHGLYEHVPALAVFFLLTGLASVGFPGTVGFISTELLVDSVVEANLYAGIGVLIASALNGIAVLRAYMLLFTGARHVSSVSVRIGARERFAVLTLSTLILLGGVFPQPGVTTREKAAVEILKDRAQRGFEPAVPSARAADGFEAPPAMPLARENVARIAPQDYDRAVDRPGEEPPPQPWRSARNPLASSGPQRGETSR
jgi:NADH-quinone oxidoreductase subunit M